MAKCDVILNVNTVKQSAARSREQVAEMYRAAEWAAITCDKWDAGSGVGVGENFLNCYMKMVSSGAFWVAIS